MGISLIKDIRACKKFMNKTKLYLEDLQIQIHFIAKTNEFNLWGRLNILKICVEVFILNYLC